MGKELNMHCLPLVFYGYRKPGLPSMDEAGFERADAAGL
jgi:hypothetical protein